MSRFVDDIRKERRREDRQAPTVTVERIIPVNSSGALRGFASVDVGGKMKVHDCRIVKNGNQAAWVALPQGSYEKDGKRRWYPIIELPDAVKDAIQRAVLEAWVERGGGG